MCGPFSATAPSKVGHTRSLEMEFVLDQLCDAIQKTSLSHRPFVTLTWAQSLDGKLSTSATTQTRISNSSSMQLTHALRALHDSILIGSNTAVVDRPRLTTRLTSQTQKIVEAYLPSLKQDVSIDNPLPVVLDSSLRTPATSPFLDYPRKRGKPFIFSSDSALPDAVIQEKTHIIRCPTPNGPLLDLSSVLSELKSHDVRSVMVEGGTSVLSSFLQRDLWDIAIVTVAPTIFGAGASLSNSQAMDSSFQSLRFSCANWAKFDDDAVLVARPPL